LSGWVIALIAILSYALVSELVSWAKSPRTKLEEKCIGIEEVVKSASMLPVILADLKSVELDDYGCVMSAEFYSRQGH
jgi:hypothetical protein